MVFASAAGFGFTAAQSTHLASQQDLAVTTGRDVSIASGRSFVAAFKGAVSIFRVPARHEALRRTGKVEVQAQSDAVELTALKDVTITSTDGKIILNAAKEIWIGAGGSYIKINAEGIENGTPGHILEKASFWDKPAAASMHMQLPKMPYVGTTSGLFSQKFDLSQFIKRDPASKKNWSRVEYEIRNAKGNC